MGEALAIVWRALSGDLLKKAGLTRATGQAGGVTLIQRFGSALNLNIHFHMLCLDGAYAMEQGRPRFRRVPSPTPAELDTLLQQITARVGRHLERRGLLVRDLESSHLARAPGDDAALEHLQGHSITYRIALGPQEGRKAFTLQTVPAREQSPRPFLASHAGFSLHAGVAVRGDDRKTLERLCRYITRPALAEDRLSLTPQGRVRYALKTPYRNGTTHVVFEPLDFLARLAALVPAPRVHLTRYRGVFAPHSRWRAQITPAGRGSGRALTDARTPAERHRAMTWAQRLKRVFRLDLESCEGCGGPVRVIAGIEDPLVIASILAHLDRWAGGDSGSGRRARGRRRGGSPGAGGQRRRDWASGGGLKCPILRADDSRKNGTPLRRGLCVVGSHGSHAAPGWNHGCSHQCGRRLNRRALIAGVRTPVPVLPAPSASCRVTTAPTAPPGGHDCAFLVFLNYGSVRATGTESARTVTGRCITSRTGSYQSSWTGARYALKRSGL